MGVHVSFLRKELQPLGGCGDGWGPAVRPQRLLRTFSMPVALVCVESGPSPGETALGARKKATPASSPVLVLLPPPLTALLLDLAPRKWLTRACDRASPVPPILHSCFDSWKCCLPLGWDGGRRLHLRRSVCVETGPWWGGVRHHKPKRMSALAKVL